MASVPSVPEGMKGSTADLRNAWKVLATVVIGVVMIILDATVINVALTSLQREYNASTSAVQWVISLYTLALGIATPIAGYLGERFGTKRTYLSALAGFALASFACGLAPTLPLLILARGLQGFAGGLAVPIGAALLFTAFPPQKRGLAYGVFGLAVIAAPAIGPLFSGALVDAGLLRWVFFLNVPVGALAVLIGSRFLREQRRPDTPRADLPGIVLAMVGLGALLLGTSLAGEAEGGWGAPLVLATLVLGLSALVLLVVVELRVADPLLDLRLFRLPSFTIANIGSTVGTIALFGSEFLLPLYLQLLRGLSAFQAGLFLLPLAIAAGVTSIVGGRISDKLGPRMPIIVGFVLLTINTFALSRITLDTNLTWIGFLLVLRGVGAGLILQNTQIAALYRVPIEKVGRATPLIQAFGQVAQAFGVATLATLLATVVTAPPSDTVLFQTQYIAGLERAYFFTSIAALAATALSLFLPGWPGAYEPEQLATNDAIEPPTRMAPVSH